MKTRLEEVNDMLKSAEWNATGGFRLWCQFEGKNLMPKLRSIEEKVRLEDYVQLRIEKAMIEKGYVHG